MAFVIAAPSSDAGKTTVTLALLAGLKQRGLDIQSFKVGPDYIDPMFHQAVTGSSCRNLDPVLTSESYMQQCFRYHCRGKAGALVEGVMGLFDGQFGHEIDDFASTAHIARLLNLPIILVINAAKVGQSIAAIVYGLMHYDPRLRIVGVILNRVGSPRHAEILTYAIQSLNLPVLGILFTNSEISLPSRHLGLVPVGELSEFEQCIDHLTHLAETSFNWDQLLPLIKSLPDPVISLWPDLLSDQLALDSYQDSHDLTIGVALDRAFNFYYADNLDLLRELGAKIHFFSPLESGLPNLDQCDGLYLGGGFPELFADQLSQQLSQQSQLSHSSPPIYAECGGLMALGQSLIDLNGDLHQMAGLLPFHTSMSSKLTLGYRSAIALRSTVMIEQGRSVSGHEFHRSQITPTASDPIYQWSGSVEGWATSTIHASYLHLHWGSQPQLALRFLQACA